MVETVLLSQSKRWQKKQNLMYTHGITVASYLIMRNGTQSRRLDIQARQVCLYSTFHLQDNSMPYINIKSKSNLNYIAKAINRMGCTLGA